MSTQSEGILLSPHTEAERLWNGAQEAFQQAHDGIAQLSETIDLGMRVVEILTIECLRKVRQEFPTTVATLLDPPPPEVNLTRDFMHAPKTLRLLDALDMLSDQELTCISPGLHKGWVDHVQVCRELRTNTKKATNLSLNAHQRGALMLIGAYRNRIFQLPPPVRIVPEEVLSAFPILSELVEQLFARESSEVS